MSDGRIAVDKVVKSIFALWSLEFACIFWNGILVVMGIRYLNQTNLRNINQTQADDETLFAQSISISRHFKWCALLWASLSMVLWSCTAFSFAIGRFFDEVCAGLEYNSPARLHLQTFIFGPLTYDDLFFRNVKTVFLFRL
jgi:hypothetical protein